VHYAKAIDFKNLDSSLASQGLEDWLRSGPPLACVDTRLLLYQRKRERLSDLPSLLDQPVVTARVQDLFAGPLENYLPPNVKLTPTTYLKLFWLAEAPAM
jgi:hypothetical protein